MAEFIKRFGGPGELPNTPGIREWWADKVMHGGPYVDSVPAVDEPQQSLLDKLEDGHGMGRRGRRRLAGDLRQYFATFRHERG